VRRRILIPLIVLLAAGPLAACSSDDVPTQADRPSGMPMDGTDDHMDDMDDHMRGGHGDPSPVADGAREIPVTADDFAFDPDEITVGAGEDVAIVLTSVDILHDFTIDELDAHVAADRGETASGGLRADEPGRYLFYCAVAGHRESGMEGTLVVEG
jgi:cytochrome c oxidase subunit II